MNNKKVFKTKDENGNEIELAVMRPSGAKQIDAQLIYNKEWRRAVEGGSVLRIRVDELTKAQNIWSDEKEAELRKVEEEILSGENLLKGGANTLSSPKEGREVALKIRKLRNDRTRLFNEKNSLDRLTAESFADTARINYLVAANTVWNSDGRSYFRGYDDFVAKSNDQVAVDAMTNYIELIMEDFPKNEFYENIFLHKYGFADDKFRLINSDGHLVDEAGKLIDEEGRYVTADGSYCDIDGKPVDKEGNYVVAHKEFAEEGV